MMQIVRQVEIKSDKMSDYEMRMLGEALNLCQFDIVILNGEEVKLQDMLKEENTWEKAWDKFDAKSD
jgi:hypothetical protein